MVLYLSIASFAVVIFTSLSVIFRNKATNLYCLYLLNKVNIDSYLEKAEAYENTAQLFFSAALCCVFIFVGFLLFFIL
jgi:hypothetical protein